MITDFIVELCNVHSLGDLYATIELNTLIVAEVYSVVLKAHLNQTVLLICPDDEKRTIFRSDMIGHQIKNIEFKFRFKISFKLFV